MGTLIYIGPSLPGLSRYTVFKEGRLPMNVAQMVKENDRLAGLIVPLDGLQQARRQMETKGHILNFYATHLKSKER